MRKLLIVILELSSHHHFICQKVQEKASQMQMQVSPKYVFAVAHR